MRNRIFAVFIFQLIFFYAARAQSDTITNRYEEYLLRTAVLQPEEAYSWSTTLNAQGQWPDINYGDKQPSRWKVTLHLGRVRQMAMAWAHPRSSMYHNSLLWEKLNAALSHWLAKRYQSSNWWHNEIGVPREMRDIIVLLRRRLDTARMRQSLETMAQLRVREDYVGSNLIWCADLGLSYGALTGDEALIARCRNLILKEIAISKGEGVKPDYSFHQHGPRLQMYQYGEAFLTESVRVAWQLRGTPLAFPPEQINILTDFTLQGWQWMARGIHTVPSTMDRSSSRRGELQGADLRPTIPFMAELQPHKAAALKKMEAIQNGTGSLIGYRHYPYSDFTAYHRPGFSVFLKTISSRTRETESINNENLKGKLLNSGDAYFIRNGREYFDLMPVWDWTTLPGVTAFKEADHIDRKAFTGSVSDSTCGLSAMDYVITDRSGKQRLSARKCWAFYKDVIICLMADVNPQNISGSIYTALDQCRWQGSVTVNKTRNQLKAGAHAIEDVKWLHHAGFAYIPLQPAAFDISLQERTGSWTTVNASEIETPVTEKVFSPVMRHSAGNTGYAVALSETPAKAARLAQKPVWKVLRNDKDCQAVQFNDGVLMTVFYAPGSVGGMQADQPCMLLRKNGVLYASDPTHKGITVNITVADKKVPVTLPADGSVKMVTP